MASYTTNLNLKKPAGSENVAIGDINNNMDTIDQAYGTLNSKLKGTRDFYAPCLKQANIYSSFVYNLDGNYGITINSIKVMGADTDVKSDFTLMSNNANYVGAYTAKEDYNNRTLKINVTLS